MALLGMMGADTGDVLSWWRTGGTVTANYTTDKFDGLYSFRCHPTTTAVGYCCVGIIIAAGTLSINAGQVQTCFSAKIKIPVLPAANHEQVMGIAVSTLVPELSVVVTSAGKLQIRGPAGAQIGSNSSVTVSTGSWYTLALGYIHSTTTVTLHVDGTQEISATHSGTVANMDVGWCGKLTDMNGQTIEVLVDLAAWGNAVGDRVDPAAVMSLIVANGDSVNNWTGGFADVDEVPQDGDTSYVEILASVGELPETFTLQNAADGTVAINAGSTITALMGEIICRRGAAGSGGYVRVTSGATNSDSTLLADYPTTYTIGSAQDRMLVTDPDTGVAWTVSGVDGVIVGPVSENLGSIRCTAVRAHVLFVPAAAGGTILPQMMQHGLYASG